jgi:hypothetical protein
MIHLKGLFGEKTALLAMDAFSCKPRQLAAAIMKDDKMNPKINMDNRR